MNENDIEIALHLLRQLHDPAITNRQRSDKIEFVVNLIRALERELREKTE